jgi:hypothetical protein
MVPSLVGPDGRPKNGLVGELPPAPPGKPGHVAHRFCIIGQHAGEVCPDGRLLGEVLQVRL